MKGNMVFIRNANGDIVGGIKKYFCKKIFKLDIKQIGRDIPSVVVS
jgi:hypothetical protein